MNQRVRSNTLVSRYLLRVDCDCTNCRSIWAESFRDNNGCVRLWSRGHFNQQAAINELYRNYNHSLTHSLTNILIHLHTRTHTRRHKYKLRFALIKPKSSELYIPLTSDLINRPLLRPTVRTLLFPFLLPHISSTTSIYLYFFNVSNSILVILLCLFLCYPLIFLLRFVPRHPSRTAVLITPTCLLLAR